MENLDASSSHVRSLLDQLLATVTETTGLPSTTSEIAVAQGRELMQEFASIPNPRARALIIEIVRAVSSLSHQAP
jgi:hypothetical protein